METIKIDGEDVAVATLPDGLQETIKNIARQRAKIVELTAQLNDSKILHDLFNGILKEQVIEYIKSSDI